jgi:hypothetical protein
VGSVLRPASALVLVLASSGGRYSLAFTLRGYCCRLPAATTDAISPPGPLLSRVGEGLRPKLCRSHPRAARPLVPVGTSAVVSLDVHAAGVLGAAGASGASSVPAGPGARAL